MHADPAADLARWADEHPDEAGWARAQRVDMLLQSGRVDEVERAAAPGDRVATRRLRSRDRATRRTPPEAPDQH